VIEKQIGVRAYDVYFITYIGFSNPFDNIALLGNVISYFFREEGSRDTIAVFTIYFYPVTISCKFQLGTVFKFY
jgi:hypothetical protein